MYLMATPVCATRSARPPVAGAVATAPYVAHLDESQSFDEVLALIGGAGVDSGGPQGTTQYAGFRLGAGCCLRGKHPQDRGDTVIFDVGWDRLRGRSALSLEMSLMMGLVRIPGAIRDRSRRFVRVYAEPGVGIRASGGAFAYYSAKAMIAFMSDRQIAEGRNGPMIEIQHRFPFSSLSRGDTRILIGWMAPLCKHCGWY